MKQMYIIALEGINCAGKGTQKELVRERMEDEGYDVFLVPQAKNDEAFSKIQGRGRGTYLLSDPIKDTYDWAEYFENQYNDFLDCMNQCDIAIFDRYKACFEVFQNYFLEEIAKIKTDVSPLLAHLPDPNMSFYLDISLEEALRRYENRGGGKE